jgi:hypothetical protein
VKVSADFGKIPKRVQGVISEEAMAFYDAPENREVLIWVQNVKV